MLNRQHTQTKCGVHLMQHGQLSKIAVTTKVATANSKKKKTVKECCCCCCCQKIKLLNKSKNIFLNKKNKEKLWKSYKSLTPPSWSQSADRSTVYDGAVVDIFFFFFGLFSLCFVFLPRVLCHLLKVGLPLLFMLPFYV